MNKLVFAFDMGKASIGYCVRLGNDIKVANSIIIDKDHAEVETQRNRRRIKRTLDAHKSREKYLEKIWQNCGLEVLDRNDDKFKKEFPSKNENIIYTSCLLRIALLQNQKLEEWQIYKALFNAIQRRGYDANLPWKSAQSDDDKENIENIKKYTQENNVELINSDKYKYPCYYDALRLGLWNENEPNKFGKAIPADNFGKVRTTNYVAPRELVINELTKLWQNAQKQLPQLNKISVEEFLFGEYLEQYGSYNNPDFRKYLGTTRDWQGVLGQKIPRFENRIISKCRLLPKRNVCKANTIENVTLVLLMKLKNLRFTDESGNKCMLSPMQITELYENWHKKYEEKGKLDATIIKKDIENITGLTIKDKIPPMKADISGRSSFCRRACLILAKAIMSGEPHPINLEIDEFIDPDGTKNGIFEDEIKNMLSKFDAWENICIPDNRDENAQYTDDVITKTDLIIGGITNPIVRNRLQIFRNLLFELAEKYGKPDEVIYEFVREGADNSFEGKKRRESYEAEIRRNEKENDNIKKELEDIDAYSSTNFLKSKLLKMQAGKCVYSGKPISPSDFKDCEIDHIFPRTMGGCDSLYNKVLCFRVENHKKLGRTPYEWLHSNEEVWFEYVSRLNGIKEQLGKKKFELLTSSPEDCEKLIESYNGLAETSYIARVSQQLTAAAFNWGLQVLGQKRHIFVNNGASTFKIRKTYKLNSILGDDEKKNRQNDKHHALDAICISYSRDFKYNKVEDRDKIENLNMNDSEFKEMVKSVIDEITPYPYANKHKLKSDTSPLETIYGKRTIDGGVYLVNRISLEGIEQKETKINSIVDEDIKVDLLDKLSLKMTPSEWQEMMKNYYHPKKQTKVKKVLVKASSKSQITIDSNGRERISEFCDFGNKGTKGQFKHSKGHKGQILYFDQKGSVKVMPIYANQKLQEIKNKLTDMKCQLYKNGTIFYSGCLIEIKNNFMAGSKEIEKGIYKLRTMIYTGQIKLESNSGNEILTSASNLVKADFEKCSVDFLK